SRLSAKPSARRRSSCIAACRLTATPTSGGSRESETSEPTVRPSRSPSTSTVSTATPVGNRRIKARRSLIRELLGEQAAGQSAPGELRGVEELVDRLGNLGQPGGFLPEPRKPFRQLVPPPGRVELVC